MTTDHAFPQKPLLIVDDEGQFLYSLSLTLRANGITNIYTCESGKKAAECIATMVFSAILLDINLPDIRGTELLEMALKTCPDVPVVMITAVNEADVAVDCLKKGAQDYLLKPLDEGRILATIKNIITHTEISSENEVLKGYLLNNVLKRPEVFSEIITNNARMCALFKYIEAIAPTPFPVLITGETGVGKELFAKALHVLSGRKGAFVTVNASGIDENVFADTLFGHVKGAFTGADKSRAGLIEQAAGGTLFLDEIGDLSPSSQIKLLRVIQNRDYFPLGSDVAKIADVRLAVATNKSIDALKSSTEFRSDLFHRLRTHHIAIPPLRERIDDIPLLVDYFLNDASKILNKTKPTPPKELSSLLSTYDFPGNIRELKAMIFDAVSVHKSRVLSMKIFRERLGLDLHKPLSDLITNDVLPANKMQFARQLPTIREATRALIEEALSRSQQNQNVAARMLGISPQALSRRLKYARRNIKQTP